jgi:hypothetical protein
MVDKNNYRAVLFRRQSGRCWYCGTPTMLDGCNGDPDTATIEHLGPDRGKRVLACYDCNQNKGRWSDAMNRKGVRMEHPSRPEYGTYRRIRISRARVETPGPVSDPNVRGMDKWQSLSTQRPAPVPGTSSYAWFNKLPSPAPRPSCHLCNIHGGCIESYHDCPNRACIM